MHRKKVWEGWKREGQERTLYARRIPSPTSLITASTSISYVPAASSSRPNQDMTWRETSLLMSCSSSRAEMRVAAETSVVNISVVVYVYKERLESDKARCSEAQD